MVALLTSAIESRADVVSLDQLFSKHRFLGGIPCAALGTKDGYLNEPISVFGVPDAGSPPVVRRPKPACVRGGGDCACVVLFTEERPLDAERSLFRVFGEEEGSVYWVAAKKSAAVPILRLATEFAEGEWGGDFELSFRKPFPAVFADEGLTKRLGSAREVFDIPSEIAERTKREVLPRLHDMELEFPSGSTDASGEILFWQSPRPDAPPVSLSLGEAREYALGPPRPEDRSRPRTWRVTVLKEDGAKRLIHYAPWKTDTRVSSYVSNGPGQFDSDGTSYVYSWIEVRGAKVGRARGEKAPEAGALASPTYLGRLVSFGGLHKAQGRTYVKLAVRAFFAAPLEHESSERDRQDGTTVRVLVYKLRDIWVDALDAQGRITFWLVDPSGP